MNIFVLHLLPRIAAIYHCDKHVVKMILETAQLLYTAHHLLGNPFDLPDKAYKRTHANHPCAIWVRESRENYKWLAQLGWWLCKEYQIRYGKHTPNSTKVREHKTEQHIKWLMANIPAGIPNVPQTPFRQAMPDQYKHEDPVQAYRTFYIESKMKARGIVKYTKRPFPEFLGSQSGYYDTNNELQHNIHS